MSTRRIERGRVAKADATKGSQTQKKVPKRFVKPTGEDAVPGRYEAGIKNDEFALLFGHTIATWVHVEDQMIQVLQDLLGSRSAPARQIFHSVVSNKARQSLMLACLQRSKINIRKTDLYEEIILQFSKLNSQRNGLVHGLWYTHETGRVFLSASSVDDFHYIDAREVKIEELESMNKALGILSNAIHMRRSPSIARTILSHAPERARGKQK
ncbi:hypothetical protein MTX26_35190 (plasmid) [Bradyrhizobium sp. ISRA443]|uniref:hypothetical protein n=1 Tax=unclassified Bradyrhizobium TaxID=2631580 RepID=UPI00247931E1|nr:MULTISPECIES: hypothetical protein [unclassified Bradyrhizobium]WGS03185.1 hypothetical protein MTX23_35430 [Bradyrhizobium sp. ISRA436]WGS10021.1 hypothetical protein MTX18_35190 [Bradyrhizobium sp. ISRA437]WGS16906.1 hypothetical protein MTX26_35190 [Bradyrhizobium sp. ISRA443]